MTSGKKQDPNAAAPSAEEWTIDEAVRYLARVAGRDLAIYLLTEAASRGRLRVTCRRFVVTNGKRVLAGEGIVRPDFWRGYLTFAFTNGRAQVIPLKALEPGEYQYTLPARTVRELLPASPAAPKPPGQGARLNRPQGAADGSRAGSAAAWLGERYPNGEWRLLTAREIHKAIEQAAKEQGRSRWPSLSSVERELRRRRQAK
jgi:hypothetical protein